MSISPALSSTSPETEALSSAELAELRRALDDCRREREQQLAALAMVPVVPDADLVAYAHAQSVRDVLSLIEAALARIDAGTYGRCVHCSSSIPRPRLELVPYTDACVPCRARHMAGR